jgi:hypothetical protein
MKPEGMRDLLIRFANVNSIPITKVTDGLVGFLCGHLSDFPDTIIINVIDGLTGQWDKRSLPQPKLLYSLCYDRTNNDRTDQYKARQHTQDKNSHRAWMTRKFRHRRALKEMSQALRSGNPLTDTQKDALRIISPYMIDMWGDDWITQVEYVDEKQALNPVTASFIGLYMDYQEKVLKPLTERQQGNLEPNKTMGR